MSAPVPAGRPRDESVDRRVVDATLDLLQADGLAALTIEGIAAEAGVSKATVYRRWDSLDEVIVDSVATLVEAIEVPDTGDIRRDLVNALRAMVSFITDSRAGTVLPWLVGEIAAQSPIGARYAATVILPRRQMMIDLIGSAVDRGELRSDLDVGTAVDTMLGPVLLRRITGILGSVEGDWPETVVDSLLDGWRRE